mmetsp:Transcript_804/g.1244  ORF Transcript_804/g.1244 Transcript_804/m.1244 type:complete len:218 (+) Transcript_804:181-834(+)
MRGLRARQPATGRGRSRLGEGHARRDARGGCAQRARDAVPPRRLVLRPCERDHPRVRARDCAQRHLPVLPFRVGRCRGQSGAGRRRGAWVGSQPAPQLNETGHLGREPGAGLLRIPVQKEHGHDQELAEALVRARGQHGPLDEEEGRRCICKHSTQLVDDMPRYGPGRAPVRHLPGGRRAVQGRCRRRPSEREQRWRWPEEVGGAARGQGVRCTHRI